MSLNSNDSQSSSARLPDWIHIPHPTKYITRNERDEINFRTLDVSPRWLERAADGDRKAWAQLMSFYSTALREGYAIPREFAEFLADRLSQVAALLWEQQRDGRPKPIKAFDVHRALLGNLKRGGGQQMEQGLHDFLHSDFAEHMHGELTKAGKTSGEATQIIGAFWQTNNGRVVEPETVKRMSTPEPPRVRHDRTGPRGDSKK